MRKNSIFFYLVTMLLLITTFQLLGILGCGSGGGGGGASGGSSGGTGKLTFTFSFPERSGSGKISISGDVRGGERSLDMDSLSSKTEYCVISIYERGKTDPVVDPVTASRPPLGTDKEVIIPGIPIGWKTVNIKGYDSNGELIEEGSADVEVFAGDNSQQVVITLTAIPASPTELPSVTASVPAEGETGVDPSVTVSATFSAEMEGSTIDDETFLLKDESNALVSGVAQLASSTVATFTPGRFLDFLATYRAIVKKEVQDTQGNLMEQDKVWSFVTRDGEWQGNKLIDDLQGNGDAGPPQVAYDDSDNAIAVWGDSGAGKIYANLYIRSKNDWQGAQPIATTTGSFGDPQIGFDSSGKAIVVYEDTGSIFAIQFDQAGGWPGGWQGPIEIDGSSSADSFRIPKIAVDKSGNAAAIWTDAGGTIYGSKYTSALGWKQAAWQVPISQLGSDALSSQYDVEFDDSGFAICVWRQFSLLSSLDEIEYNKLDAISGWSFPAQPISSDSSSAKGSPKITFLSGGSAICVWQQDDTGNTIIKAKTYASGQWVAATETTLSNGTFDYDPEIASDESGNAICVWAKSTQGVYYKKFISSQGGWIGSEATVASGTSAASPQIAFDKKGNALAVWEMDRIAGSTHSIYSKRYRSSSGRFVDETLKQLDDDSSNCYAPQVAIEKNSGRAIAVWKQSYVVQKFDIYANKFE